MVFYSKFPFIWILGDKDAESNEIADSWLKNKAERNGWIGVRAHAGISKTLHEILLK